MPTNSTIGYGITFAIWNGASYTNFVEVLDAIPPQYSRDAIDATHHASPAGFKEYIPGLKDGGEVTMTLNYIPSASDAYLAAFNASSAGQFRITLPNAVTCTFGGVITSYAPNTPRDDKMTSEIVIKVSGQPVWA